MALLFFGIIFVLLLLLLLNSAVYKVCPSPPLTLSPVPKSFPMEILIKCEALLYLLIVAFIILVLST